MADYIDSSGPQKTAKERIDIAARGAAAGFGLSLPSLDACLAKQDGSAVDASLLAGEKLGVESTPTLFINGLKVEGAQPISYIFDIVDEALRAVGEIPPPPFKPAPSPSKQDRGNGASR